MKKDTIVPFEARPAARPEERGQRAVDRQVAEVVEIFKAMRAARGSRSSSPSMRWALRS